MLFEKEKNTIGVLYAFFLQNPNNVLDVLMENGDVFQASFDTDYETDNGLEINEPDYEEFHAILLRRKDTGKLVELTYRHFPKRITCNGVFVAGTDAP